MPSFPHLLRTAHRRLFPLVSTLLLACAPALPGQGLLDFCTFSLVDGIDAPVFDTDGSTRLGARFLGQLYAGPPTRSLAPVGAPVPFLNHPATGAGSGYIIAGKVSLTNALAGESVRVELRAWEAAAGASYEAALSAGGRIGVSAWIVVQPGGEIDSAHPPQIPAPLAGLRSFPLNRVPISSGFAATTPQNQALIIPFDSLLAPVSDPDGGPVYLVDVDPMSTNGALVIADRVLRQVEYVPQEGFVGADRFPYTVIDAATYLPGRSTVWAQIAVLPQGQVVNTAQAPVVTASTTSFGFTGLPGKTYQVQRAVTPQGPWTTIGTLLLAADGTGSFVDYSPPADGAFYRTVLMP